MTLRISCAKSNSVRFYRSPGMQNQVETQKEQCQLNSDQKDSMHYLPREGGGGLRNMNLRMCCSKSNSNTFCGSPEMRNQVNTKGTVPNDINSAKFYALFATVMTLKMSCSKSNSNTSYGSPGVRNQVETQKERSQLTSIQQDSLHFFPGGGGEGGLRTMTLRMSCSKSNSNTSYGSHEVRNQVETQKERSQLTSIQQDLLHYFPGGGGGGLRTMTLRMSCS